MEILNQLQGKVIVSVQADEGEPFSQPYAFRAMTQSVLDGGAAGLRLAGSNNIKATKVRWPEVPVIGITKPRKMPANYKDLVYITPTFLDVQAVADAGAEIVAMDATLRPRPKGETLVEIVAKTRKQYPNLLLMADISTKEEGFSAAELGFDLISTTLSGYTAETATTATKWPDLVLLETLINAVGVPVILEGRVWEPAEARQALDLGAFAVVIGSAITRPHLITQRFCN